VRQTRSQTQRARPEVRKALPHAAEKFLAVARVVRPQGRWGEVVAEILTDFPQRFAARRKLYVERLGSAPEPVAVEKVWLHKGRVVLKFAGVDSIDKAERLRGLYVLIPREERVALPAHSYYVWELKGCRVSTNRQGVPSEVGTVTDVESTGGADLLHVATPRGEVLIPLARDICKRIDTEAKTIVIDPPEDLLELSGGA